MSSNPLVSRMNSATEQAPEPENDDATLQQCEQKINDLEQRVSAIERKIGLGGSKQSAAPGSPSPFYG